VIGSRKWQTSRTGPRGAVKRAWVVYIRAALDDAQLRDHQETYSVYRDLR